MLWAIMHSYVAQLGHQPLIARAELLALLPDMEPGRMVSAVYFMFKTKEELNQAFLDSLGGTILIAKCIHSAADLKDIPAMLETELQGSKGKVSFALRIVGLSPARGREFYKASKDHLKKKGMSSRYIGNERSPALPIQLHDEGLLDAKKGAELLILHGEHGTWVGRTIAAQNVKAYTKRDMDKPVRDTTVGLLPPKLAQTLLNFGMFLVREQRGELPKTLTIFDPFCGTGVIPMEALHRKWPVLASDISPKAVTGTEKNLEWMRKHWSIGKRDVASTVWKQDAQKPFKLETKPDVIVTETTLGPSLRARPQIKDAERFKREAEKIESEFLKNVHDTLPGTPIVATWPVWYAKKYPLTLEKMEKAIEKAGYKLVLPPHVHATTPERHSLIYRRNDQFVGREIVLLLPA